MLRLERFLLDTGCPPGVNSQAPGIRGSARVKSHDRDTRGNKMNTNNSTTNDLHKEIFQGVVTLSDERPKKGLDFLALVPEKAQPVGKKRHREAPRRRHKRGKWVQQFLTANGVEAAANRRRRPDPNAANRRRRPNLNAANRPRPNPNAVYKLNPNPNAANKFSLDPNATYKPNPDLNVANKFSSDPYAANKANLDPNAVNKFSLDPNATYMPNPDPNAVNKFNLDPNAAYMSNPDPNAANKANLDPNVAYKPNPDPNAVNKFSLDLNAAYKSNPDPNAANKFSSDPNAAYMPNLDPNAANKFSSDPNAANKANLDPNAVNTFSPDPNVAYKPNPDPNAVNKFSSDPNVANKANPDSNAVNKSNPDPNAANKFSSDPNAANKANLDSNAVNKFSLDPNAAYMPNPDPNAVNKFNLDSNTAYMPNPDPNDANKANLDPNVVNKFSLDPNAAYMLNPNPNAANKANLDPNAVNKFNPNVTSMLEERDSHEAIERPISEQNASSSADVPNLHKRCKITDQRTFAQDMSGIIKVAIVPTAYPDRKLSTKERYLLKRAVLRRIFDPIAKGTKPPTFKGTSDREGAVVFNCTDEHTVEWLKNLTAENNLLERMDLRVMGFDKLFQRHRIIVYIEDPNLSVKEALKLLDRQNAYLDTRDWVIMSGSESRNNMSIQFTALVREQSLKAIKVLDYRPYCGLDQARIRVQGEIQV